MVGIDSRGGSGGELLLLMVFCASRGQRILLEKDADDSGGDFVVDDGLVVFADDVDTEFLRIDVKDLI